MVMNEMEFGLDWILESLLEVESFPKTVPQTPPPSRSPPVARQRGREQPLSSMRVYLPSPLLNREPPLEERSRPASLLTQKPSRTGFAAPRADVPTPEQVQSLKCRQCQRIDKPGGCVFGDECYYAHSVEEMMEARRHSDVFHYVCRFYQLNQCKKLRCGFLHEKVPTHLLPRSFARRVRMQESNEKSQ
ncbi:MAG: uncharacterized protein KVP18_004436 [Porospora cf. gigantea A]|uniref:uncharacterized protein n=1 Tax=Porospora cf. gigantea A TaxID=2853593 RepID=UPI00355A930B|nr:MAG: hypothetical protein KVP18_004436 [Porospora cf. gigantea A]